MKRKHVSKNKLVSHNKFTISANQSASLIPGLMSQYNVLDDQLYRIALKDMIEIYGNEYTQPLIDISSSVPDGEIDYLSNFIAILNYGLNKEYGNQIMNDLRSISPVENSLTFTQHLQNLDRDERLWIMSNAEDILNDTELISIYRTILQKIMGIDGHLIVQSDFIELLKYISQYNIGALHQKMDSLKRYGMKIDPDVGTYLAILLSVYSRPIFDVANAANMKYNIISDTPEPSDVSLGNKFQKPNQNNNDTNARPNIDNSNQSLFYIPPHANVQSPPSFSKGSLPHISHIDRSSLQSKISLMKILSRNNLKSTQDNSEQDNGLDDLDNSGMVSNIEPLVIDIENNSENLFFDKKNSMEIKSDKLEGQLQ